MNSVENLTDEEMVVLQVYYLRLAEMTKDSRDMLTSHSIEEARALHNLKVGPN